MRLKPHIRLVYYIMAIRYWFGPEETPPILKLLVAMAKVTDLRRKNNANGMGPNMRRRIRDIDRIDSRASPLRYHVLGNSRIPYVYKRRMIHANKDK